MIKIIKVLLLPLSFPFMMLFAWLSCIFTWGLYPYKDALDALWRDYWKEADNGEE